MQDLWYTTSDGRNAHVYVDFSSPETLRKPLSDMGGADFADEFIKAMNDFAYDMSIELEDIKDGIIATADSIEENRDLATDELCATPDSVRDLFNQLCEVLGDENDTVNELLSRIDGKLSTVEDYLSDISGDCYDLNTLIQEWKSDFED